MVKECTIGQTEKCMTESGKRESKRVTECGRAFSETATWASGATPKRMGTAFTSGRTETGTKAAGISV